MADVLDGTATPSPMPSSTRPSTAARDSQPHADGDADGDADAVADRSADSPATTMSPPPVFEGCGHGFWKKPSRVWTGFRAAIRRSVRFSQACHPGSPRSRCRMR